MAGGGWSPLGRGRVVVLQSGGFEGTPHCVLNSLLPHTVFLAVSIKRSAGLVEPVFQVRVMAALQSADEELVLL